MPLLLLLLVLLLLFGAAPAAAVAAVPPSELSRCWHVPLPGIAAVGIAAVAIATAAVLPVSLCHHLRLSRAAATAPACLLLALCDRMLLRLLRLRVRSLPLLLVMLCTACCLLVTPCTPWW